MYLCDGDSGSAHEDIIVDGGDCPLCSAMSKAEDAEGELKLVGKKLFKIIEQIREFDADKLLPSPSDLTKWIVALDAAYDTLTDISIEI